MPMPMDMNTNDNEPNEPNEHDGERTTPPADQHEYVLWRALQRAPYPPARWRSGAGAVYGQPMTWADVDWLRDYVAWFERVRNTALRQEPLGALGTQLLYKQLENDRLRDLLREARASIDHGPLLQKLDHELSNLDEDIDL